MNPCIHRITAVRLYFLPVRTRVPLKFGPETLTAVTCARVALTVADEQGNEAEGWGETPLSVQWVWPSLLWYEPRHKALKDFTKALAPLWMQLDRQGHPLELGHAFQEHFLRQAWTQFNATPTPGAEAMPWLAALVCSSPFDLALHDAFGKLVECPVYETYGPEFLVSDLARFLEPAVRMPVRFQGRYPAEFLIPNPPRQLRAWHLVGGLDLLEPTELTGTEPNDGLPVVLTDWIERDGLKCLKVKLRGNDSAWDYSRLFRVGSIALAKRVEWLSADFNCTVQEPDYVNEILDRLKAECPRVYDRVLYVEQPFPYELEHHRLDVRSVSERKPLFLDESAHDWRLIRLGRELGWTGVALKTCKTQTGAILSACWARAHGLNLMVQDLTNPMLAQIPHVLLAAHVGTIMGVETNAMQFYPAASATEATVHPGLYRRRDGMLDLSTIRGPGFGYRVEEIGRELPKAEISLE
jgi:L-alanine-DL-glutamate epimerase-like enolase superfamily enzyme